MQTMKIPNWIVRPSTSIRLFQRIISGRKFTASPCGADTLVRKLRNLSPTPANQNLVVSYTQLSTPLLAKSWKPEARSYEVYNSISND